MATGINQPLDRSFDGAHDRPATLEEIAEVMAVSKRSVERWAKKPPGWPCSYAESHSRHKKQLYALKDLPTDIQLAVFKARQSEHLTQLNEQMERQHDTENTRKPPDSVVKPGNSGRIVPDRAKDEPISAALDAGHGGGRKNLLQPGLPSTQTGVRADVTKRSNPVAATGLSPAGSVGQPVESDRKGAVSNQPVDGGIALRDTGRDLSAYTTDQRDIHLAILTIMRWLDHYPGPRSEALRALNADYQAGTLSDVLTSALSRCKQKQARDTGTLDVLSLSTINSWLARFKKQGNYIPQIRQKDFTIKSWHVLLKERLDNNPQKCSYALIHEELVKTYPDLGYDAMINWIRDKYSRMDTIKGRHTGMQLRAKKAYQPRTSAGLRPWDEVHADGWNTHFTAPHPRTGEFVTYELWDFHDVATRYIPPFGIGLSECFEVIAKGIKNAISDQGVMCILQTDSTKIIKANKKFTGDPVKSISDKAGITIVHPKTVGNAQANGIAENWHAWADKQCRVLATYQAQGQDSLTLRNVKKITAQMVKAADKGELELRDKLKARAEKIGGGIVFGSFDEAVGWIEVNLRKKWNNKPHSSLPKVRCPNSLKMRHQTPQEALDEHKALGWEPVWLSEALLDDLFLVHTELKVKRGMVMPYGGMLFRSTELDAYEGDKVIVAYDSMDYSQVIVKDLKGEFICVAAFLEPTRYRAVTAMEDANEKRAVAQIRNKEKQIVQIEKRAGLDQGNIINGEVLQRIPVIEQEIVEPLKRIVIEGAFNKQEPEVAMMTAQETTLMIAKLLADKNE